MQIHGKSFSSHIIYLPIFLVGPSFWIDVCHELCPLPRRVQLLRAEPVDERDECVEQIEPEVHAVVESVSKEGLGHDATAGRDLFLDTNDSLHPDQLQRDLFKQVAEVGHVDMAQPRIRK